MTYFTFCIHNHQPVGNFDHVLQDAYEKAYWPFLLSLSKYPSIKLTLHTSGYLLDWIAGNHPEYIELLRDMVEAGQVEIMGGGYYEPILAVIPEADRISQITLLSDRIYELFNKRPRGLWLAERVWEPSLAASLRDAGVEYIIVDDYHFIKSGLERKDLGGYYVTEDQGKTIKVFPGSERLRYLIPFKPIESLVEHLKSLNGSLSNGNAAIYGDDGEKFGVWPGTYKWLYEDGWLDGFFKAIDESLQWLTPATFSEYIDRESPIGRVYLPTTSYREMGEWSLPPLSSKAYTELIHDLESWDRDERVLRFLQGGIWRNFFSKYPESNWMHKRMLKISAAVRSIEQSGGDAAVARRFLLKAQCNDAYWHGIFGGLYLPHLRGSVYENLIKAENHSAGGHDGVVIREDDIDADTFREIEIRSRDLNIFIDPDEGGGVVELDYRPKAINLSNTLSRWLEGYHHKLKAGMLPTGGEAASIHDMVLVKEAGLERYLSFDAFRRGSFIERVLGPDETIEAFIENAQRDMSHFHAGRFDADTGGPSVLLSKKGRVFGGDAVLKKELKVTGPASFSVAYDFDAGDVSHTINALRLRFCVELNLILPCCNGPACMYRFKPHNDPSDDIGLGSAKETHGISGVSLVDTHTGAKIDVEADKEATLWRHPVYTVSLSEAGFEKIFQGSRLLFLFPLILDEKGGVRVRFSVNIGDAS